MDDCTAILLFVNIIMYKFKEVISTVAMKGGTGKTTTVISLAGALLHCNKNLRILIIDLDSQGNISTLLGWKQQPGSRTLYEALRDKSSLPVYETNIKSENGKGGVFLVPYNPLLSSVQIELSRSMQPKVVLRKCFGKALDDNTGVSLPDDITEAFDYVLLDCPPALNNVTTNAFLAADHILVPMTAELLPLKGMRMLDAYIEQLKQVKPSLGITGVFFTRYKARHNLAKAVEEAVSEVYGDVLLKTKIRENTSMAESAGSGNDIFDYASRSAAAEDYRELTKEILNKLK